MTATDTDVTQRPVPQPGILDIAAYVPGKSKATGGARVYKLSSNETPFGPSPEAMAAFRQISGHLEVYPDGAATQLRAAIGRATGLDPDRIVCGNGSDELIGLVADAFVGPGDEAIHTAHGFAMYDIYIRKAGGVPVVAAERDLTADVDAILAQVTPRTRAVFLANPNNPTGTYLPFSEVRRLHAALPKRVVLLLDAAYAEYVRRNDYESGLELAASASNVVMTRTFSKIHGLAALRIGWCTAAPEIVDVLNRIRGPFNLSVPAIAAGAAAIADRGHVETAVAHNDLWLPRVSAALDEIGLEAVPSVANFVLIRFPDRPGHTAAEADAYLSAHGVVVRRMEAYGLPDCLRITIGSEEANTAAIRTLSDFMSGGGA